MMALEETLRDHESRPVGNVNVCNLMAVHPIAVQTFHSKAQILTMIKILVSAMYRFFTLLITTLYSHHLKVFGNALRNNCKFNVIFRKKAVGK